MMEVNRFFFFLGGGREKKMDGRGTWLIKTTKIDHDGNLNSERKEVTKIIFEVMRSSITQQSKRQSQICTQYMGVYGESLCPSQRLESCGETFENLDKTQLKNAFNFM